MRSSWFALVLEAEYRRFVLLLPVAMGTAILIYYALPSEPPLWLGAGVMALAGLVLALGWRQPYIRFAALLVLAGSLGFARAQWETASMPPMLSVPTGVTAVSGFVQRVEPLPSGARVLLRAPRINYGPTLRRMVRIKLKQGDSLPIPGTLVKTYALLFAPERPAYPGGWSQQRDYYFENIAAVGVAVTDLWVLRPAKPGHLADILQNIRGNIAKNLLATLPLPTASVAVTLLTGDEQVIPPKERHDFVLAGLAHILAVAGLHVGIVMGLFFVMTRWLLSRNSWITLHWPGKPIAAVLALAAGGGYALLTGAHLPILRSLAMACLVTLGILLGRRAISLRGLGMAACVLMLATPYVIMGPSFQMSFSAVAALITGYAAVQPVWIRFHAARHGVGLVFMVIAELAYTSLLAGGASMPFAAYQFQQITPYWIPANLVAVPLTAFWILPLGLVGLALLPLHLAWLAFKPMGWGIAIMVWITRQIAVWPDAQIIVPPVPSLAILLFAAGLAWLCIWRSYIRFAGVGLMLAALGVGFIVRPPDVLVSPTARLIAINQPHTVLVVAQRRASRFTLEQWRHVWGNKPLVLSQCSGETCLVGKVLYATVPVTSCPGALLVVSPVAQPGCAGAAVLDSPRARQEGALAAWIGVRHVLVRSDASVQGQRPWTR